MMADTPRTGRRSYPLTMLYVYLTERCNLFCRHCWIQAATNSSEVSPPSLPLDHLAAIVEQARPLGLAAVKLTGGEPLLHPEIVGILEFLRTKDLGCILETNGAFCTPEIAGLMAASKNPFVAVSLDGAEAATHDYIRRVPGSFRAAVDGVKTLVASGLRPQIIMTVMPCNQDQLEAVVRLSESLGAASVKFNVLQPLARAKEIYAAGEALGIAELIALGRWVDQELSTRTTLRLFFHQPPAFRPLGKMFGDNGDGCGRCGILGILGVLAHGAYALCGIGHTVPELVFGHVTADSLERVWRHHPTLQALRAGLPHQVQGICRQCLLKHFCLASCVAQTYDRHKSFWEPYWYCQEASDLGLFPDSRLLNRACNSLHGRAGRAG